MPAKIIATLILATTLAGCGLDILEGKASPAQIEHERRQALLMPAPMADGIAPSADAAPVEAPALLLADAALQPTADPEPCVEVFRQTSCVDGVPTEWVW